MTITDTSWEIRSLRAQIRVAEQEGDVEGAASLAWQLVDALDDAADAAVAPQAPAIEIRWVGEGNAKEIGLAYVGVTDGMIGNAEMVAAAHRQDDDEFATNGYHRYVLTTTRVARDGVTAADGTSAMPLAYVRTREGAVAWLMFMAGLAAETFR